MSQRHKMLSITYDWETERAIISYSSDYKNYCSLERLDSLSDIIGMLQTEYDQTLATSTWDN